MNILFLSTEGTKGGAAIVTGRLVAALRAAGEDARMLVGRNCGPQPWMAETGGSRRKLAKLAERGEIFAANGFNRADLWKVSTGRFGIDICSHPWVREADVIVIGWVCQGFLSLSGIKRLCGLGKPLMWWMHDLWCATGICHLPGECTRFMEDCGDCPMLHLCGGSHDLSRRVWKRKRRLFDNSSIRFLAVSSWQREVAISSSLLGGQDVEVLHHAFPVDLYHVHPAGDTLPTELAPMVELGDRRLIVMGAARLDDPVKDLPMAIASLNAFAADYPATAEKCAAVFFGGIRDAGVLDGLQIPYRYLGPLGDSALRELYARSAVVLSTSRFETLGATLMEGMAAGAVPVTFGRGGQRDIVTDGVNGYIADYGSPQSVARYLKRAIDAPFPREGQHASVASRFSAGNVARRFIDLLKIPE